MMSSNNTYFSISDLKQSNVSEGTAFLVQDLSVANGVFFWTPGNYAGQADETNIIKADSIALSVGAWVRQSGSSISFNQDGSNSTIITIQDLAELVVCPLPAGCRYRDRYRSNLHARSRGNADAGCPCTPRDILAL